MSIEKNGISTIREAWRNAAGEETRPDAIPSEYTDNRALPNIQAILDACNVTVNPEASYLQSQCIRYEDLLVAPRELTFTIQGQTNQIGTYVDVSPQMVTSMSINGAQLTQQELLSAYQGNGTYRINDYQNTKIEIDIDASYADQSIAYKHYYEQSTFKSFNGKLILLRDVNSHPMTECKYSWTTRGVDIDLNFFVVKKDNDVHSMVGMIGYDQAGGNYWPVPKNHQTSTFPASGCDFCVSLDVDDTGGGNLTEILSIYPVDMSWNQIMENYDFVYAAIDYAANNNMHGMSAKLSSDDFPVSKELELDSTASVINAWLICRFGSTTNGQILKYATPDGESVVYSSNTTNVPKETSLVGVDLNIRQGSDWSV